MVFHSSHINRYTLFLRYSSGQSTLPPFKNLVTLFSMMVITLSKGSKFQLYTFTCRGIKMAIYSNIYAIFGHPVSIRGIQGRQWCHDPQIWRKILRSSDHRLEGIRHDLWKSDALRLQGHLILQYYSSRHLLFPYGNETLLVTEGRQRGIC